jgi:nitrate/nitrite transport system ATP-binding protein
LDALTRAHLQDSDMEIHASLGNTVIMITHDVDEAVLLSDRIVMMTNGPAATIGKILDVKLPRPRNRVEMADNADYNHCRAEVLKFLYARHKKADKEIEPEQPENEPESLSATAGAGAEIKPFPKRNRVGA